MASTTGKNRSILAGLVAGSAPAVTETPIESGRAPDAAPARLGDRLCVNLATYIFMPELAPRAFS